jgi:hypothetical protein
MATYPEQLMPETVDDLRLPSGPSVQIPKTQPVFRLWGGEFTGDTWGNKTLIDVDGTPMFAELAILKLFQKDGWLEAAMRTGLDPSAFLIVELAWASSSIDNKAPRWANTRLRIKPVSAGRGESSETTARNPIPSSQASERYVVFYDAYDPDAHDKFIGWVERNQRGYVIGRRSSGDAMIHQAYCGHFKHGDESVSLTRTMKVCSTNKDDRSSMRQKTATMKVLRSITRRPPLRPVLLSQHRA